MKEAEGNREIQVRTITGESTTVSISSHSTIEDLKKLLLNQSFLPASNSPNFHLFFKGVKLRLQSLISTHCIEPGDFLVLVPFTRKEPSQTRKSEQSKTSLNNGLNNDSISKFADLAWSDMMQDLSYLHETSNDETATNDKVGSFSLGDRTETMAASFNTGDRKDTMDEISNFRSFGKKRGRGFDFDKGIGLPYDLILSSLQFSSEGVLDEHNCDVFVKVLESVNCLSDPRFGFCLLSRKAKFWAGDMGVGANNSSSCLCPAWLKIIMKAFAFLNIFSAFLHFQQKSMTTAYLEEALNQLAKSGIMLGMKDIEHLSVLSPKGVRFSDNEMEKSSFGDTLVIINCSTERKDQVDNPKTARKRLYVPKIVSALKKRESSFKTILSEAVQVLVCKKKTEMAEAFSLEDLILSVKDRSTAVSGNEAKRAKRSGAASSSDSDHLKCHETSSLLPVEMVEHLRKGIGSTGQMVHVEDIGARKATYMEIPNQLSENLRSALKSMGIAKLYSHQAESIQASLAGKNVVVATMTSSGKSLCYNLPVLEVLSQNLLSCALYLFPTKALAQDQLRALLDMTKGIDASLNIGIYDGDTSQKERTWLRDNARLLITNPDMLHISILPHHEKFRRILSNLRFVIIDEAHAYKGAFGCHTALIIRRLRRLCSHVYGSDPSFVFCTATSANPLEHCMELANLPTLELIQSDGSPSARKLFILWNPVVSPKTILKETQSSMDTSGSTNVNSNLRHSSPLFNVSCLFAEMVQHGLRCIAFCKSRKLCEIVLSYTREILQDTGPHLVDSICVYRAGYIAEDRRRIERDFFDGKLCGVAATNALELGIDVGHIDVTLHLGFPGSIASLWQQAGRAGRREKPSLAVYVAFGGPLDQYFMNQPKKLFGSPIECCHIDSQNQQVLEQHLVCAAHEHSLCLLYDEKYFGSGLSSAINSLKTTGYLSCDQSCDSSTKIWNYIGHEKFPSHSVSIRAIENERYEVIDQRSDELLEEIEESKAFFQVYEGAVYMRQGKTYLVKKLDLSSKTALCEEADLKYYTRTRDYTDVHVNGGKIAYPVKVAKIQLPRTTAKANTCKVTTNWFGFYRIWRGSNQIFDTIELSLPSYSYNSQAVWIPVPQLIKAAVNKRNFDFRGGLHAASHALLNVVPLHIICNTSDLAPECPNPHDSRYYPERILLYDQHPGGIGVSVQVQPLFTELLTAALELLTSCYCFGDAGCPNCVQSFACHEYNEVLHKDAAIMIIKGVLDAEKLYFGGSADSSRVEDHCQNV